MIEKIVVPESIFNKDKPKADANDHIKAPRDREFGDNFLSKWNSDISIYGEQGDGDQYLNAINKLFNKYSVFLDSGKQKETYLVAGKVQSGKTAHMLYTIAWAKDNGFDLVIVFSGVTKSLNDQTSNRFRREIGKYDNPARIANVVEVPVLSTLDDSSGESVLYALSDTRYIPVLISMKNENRIRALKKILMTLPESAKVLVIDDEADQVSPDGNTWSRKDSDATVIHSALVDLYKTPSHKTLWVSYTATPQALFLTDLDDELRPEYCSVIPPRLGYFGLEDIISSQFYYPVLQAAADGSKNDGLAILNDKNRSEISSYNHELTRAIWSTILSSAVLRYYPKVFYQSEPHQIAKSVQMLVHESNMKFVHEENLMAVNQALHQIRSSYSEELFLSELEVFFQGIRREWADAFRKRWEEEAYKGLSQMHCEIFENILCKTEVRIINSDYNDDDRPVTSEDYDRYPTWIIIGGDIVGRGVTLPTLITSYHTRDPKQSKLDTVLQQMRACGYRQNYSHMIRFYSPQSVRDTLIDMSFSDSILWDQLKSWDEQNVNLKESSGLVYFSASSNSNYAPTRKNVQDRRAIQTKRTEANRTFLSLRNLFDPCIVKSNLDLLHSLLEEHEYTFCEDDNSYEWLRIADVDMSLLNNWQAHGNDKKRLALGYSLYTMMQDWEDKPILNHPASLLIRTSALKLWSNIEEDNAYAFIKSDSSSWYSYNASLANGSDALGPHISGIDNWVSLCESRSSQPASKTQSLGIDFFQNLRLASPHIGTPQRRLADNFGSGLTTIVEPILAVKTRKQGEDSKIPKAVGLAFSSIYRKDQMPEANIRIVTNDRNWE